MSKAAKAIRRSGVRLKSLRSGHTGLQIVLSDLSNLRQKMKDSSTAEENAFDSISKWAQEDDLPALQDVLHQVGELRSFLCEFEQNYISDVKEYKRVYEHIFEMEKKVDGAKKNLSHWEDKEKKYTKELQKAKEKDVFDIERKLENAKSQKELAIVDVRCSEQELKVMKLMSVKGGLLDLANSMSAMADKLRTVSEAQRELAMLIPDVAERDTSVPIYNSVKQSAQILYRAKTKVSSGPPTYKAGTSTAPTPYCDPDPPPAYPPPSQSPSNGRGIPRFNSMPSQISRKADYEEYDSFDSD